MERTVTVAILEGLHARPAAMFVQEASKQPVAVTISRGEDAPVDAASILGVMTLGAAAGEVVTLRTEGDSPDDVTALDALEAFLSQETI
ncbi:HPr family phosphocarrier protein [Flavimobilis sp. GY10621]|uniref:Phosphocarrier protein HPr n=1 Tax=Flavimobilis rhizosphaerae TaxID=2775421 RepID=A0ABR9DMA5_9MICO|nr:HPr family phosphocarrier protein [Flavimobilis rhizosphaerae]MBD9698266.1 HPr family phosphocarrier protein [Flavimobilis rhizosphaerae]